MAWRHFSFEAAESPPHLKEDFLAKILTFVGGSVAARDRQDAMLVRSHDILGPALFGIICGHVGLLPLLLVAGESPKSQH
jgi:hypothetical protein